MGVNYREYIRSDEWRNKARDAITRSTGRCAMCGTRKNLTVHHNTYERIGNELPTDLTVVCWKCHRRHHLRDDKVNVKDVKSALSKAARRMIQQLDVDTKNGVTLTKSERTRREEVARRALEMIAGRRSKGKR